VCPTPIIRAPVDRRLLRQALTNLLANAIKYSPDGGDVLFSLHTHGRSAVIELRDTGMGISDEDQARVYEPFHRGANVETMPGTGLGLTIVQEAIKAHGGTIALASALGRGSTFTITLPIVSVKSGAGVH
jgi:signal transduction histidine kinase